MNLKIRKRLLTILLSGFTISMCSACYKEEEIPEPVSIECIPLEEFGEEAFKEIVEETVETIKTEELEIEEVESTEIEETEEEIIEEPITESENSLITVTKVKATSNVNIRALPDTESEILGKLKKNNSLDYMTEDDNWYKVKYNNEMAYVSKDYATTFETKEFEHSFTKTVYLTKPSELYEDENFETEIVNLNKLELLEVYGENDNSYLVKIDDNIGYISKDNTEELSGKFVVVDISDQQMYLYDNGEITLTSPVVSGKAKRSPSTQGLFSIFEKSKNRNLVGPGYKSYVNVMMKYHNGEGLHDAEYHTDENGKKHGWRDISEFGGDTYLTNGSHGCINMPNQEAKELYEQVEVGTKVLVKE